MMFFFASFPEFLCTFLFTRCPVFTGHMTYHPLANPVEKYGQFYGLPSLESPQGGPKNQLKVEVDLITPISRVISLYPVILGER